MHELYKKLIKFLEDENKEECVSIVLKELECENITIPILYDEVLKPALNSISDEKKPQELQIWREHVRSSIVRTIIECSYPYIIKEKNKLYSGKSKGTVAVICPDGEYHEIGAKMVSDFFDLAGYNSIFVGSSTPKQEFLDVVNNIKPKYIAISVTNYFNLVATKKIIHSIKDKRLLDTKIIVGGNAFKNNSKAHIEIGADIKISTYDEILNLDKENN